MKQHTLISRLVGKPLGLTVLTAALALGAAMPASAQEKVLRIGMTAADIPRTLGQPDQGFEGNRFTGIPMYDSLTQWDLSKTDVPSVVIPALLPLGQWMPTTRRNGSLNCVQASNFTMAQPSMPMLSSGTFKKYLIKMRHNLTLLKLV